MNEIRKIIREAIDNFDAVKENRPVMEERALEAANKLGARVLNDRFIMLYHGTSAANHKKIIKTNKFNAHSWFAIDFETSESYAKMMTSPRQKHQVIQVLVYAGSLFATGEYFTSNEELYYDQGFYIPKDFKL